MFHAEIYSKKVTYKDKEVRVAAIRDISLRKALEVERGIIEQKFKQLFNNMTSGFALHKMIYDQKGVAVDYEFVEANPAYERLTGLKVCEILGKTGTSIFPETENYWIDMGHEVASTGKARHFHSYDKELGKYFNTYLFCPQKGFFAITFDDITEQKLAEDKIHFQQSALQSIIHQTANVVGQEYFSNLVLVLNRVLHADYTFIGLLDDKSRVTTVALCDQEQIVENITYHLEDTPCEHVVNKHGHVGPRLRSSRDGRAGVLQLRLDSHRPVITSYSIHYTKLYEG